MENKEQWCPLHQIKYYMVCPVCCPTHTFADQQFQPSRPPSPATEGKEEGYCEDHCRPYIGECPDCLREDGPEFAPAVAEEEGEKKEEILNTHCPLEKFNQIMDACNFDFDKMIYDCMSEFAAWKLCAAQAKIAALEQTIREQKEWINSHL